jgi:parallel beta-helix repeat protein
LDLKGHLVACGGRGLSVGCIVLTGAGTRLLNGTVTGIFFNIILEGQGGHTVRNVTSTAAEFAIAVESDNNRLINVLGESVAFNPAFVIDGNRNRLTDSSADCFAAFGGCIEVRGNENRLIDNFATSRFMSAGFLILGHNNVLRGNQAIENFRGGIVVTGTGNRLRHNRALGNTLDLQDTNGDCAHNTWRQNTFETSDPACIGQGSRESVADMER